jgi:hypothetical protein
VVSSEEDAVAKQGEARTSVHLPLDHLGLVIDPLGPAVMVRERERGGDGRAIEV